MGLVMDGPNPAEPLSLTELVEPSRWQRLQDHFASVLGILIRTISPTHTLLVNPSWPSGLPIEPMIALLKIGEELDHLVPLHELPLDISSLTTSLGMTYAVVPLRATAEQLIAYFVIGPMIVGPREDELQFQQRVEAMGLEARALWPVLLSLKLYTFTSIRSALHLIEEVGTSVVQLAYQVKRLSTIMPEASRVDQAVVTYHRDRVLQALLDAATLATKADGGSVMVYDAEREALHITAAHGLSNTVVAQTRLKRGDGLAGLAVTEKSILVVDAQTTDDHLKARMHRPELVSSLVAPVMLDSAQEPIGVLNLRTTTPQKHFTREHVELLRRLLDLARTALSSFSVALQTPPTPRSS